MSQPLRLGVAGLGTVAQGVVRALANNQGLIDSRAGRPLQLVAVASRSRKDDVDLGNARFSTDLQDLIAPDVDVVVELIGGDTVALELCRDAIAAGKHVVTANKALIAEHGGELAASAQNAGVSLAYEAAVAGAIPVLGALSRGLASNRIHWLAGIINGTSNYILSAMAGINGQPMSFTDALADAQALGYAEADPTFDVQGIDAAHKLTILTALAFDTRLAFDEVYTEGIDTISVEDIEYAGQLGYAIKHLGIARETASGIEARVHPALVPQSNLLANVHGVMNAVMVHADGAGTSMYYGAGAGMDPTASAVMADVIDVAQGQCRTRPQDNGAPFIGINQIVTSYYLRIPTQDKAGVFGRLTTLLSDHGISIEAAIQREHTRSHPGDRVPIVIMTQPIAEHTVRAALTAVGAMPEVVDEVRCIRVETLD